MTTEELKRLEQLRESKCAAGQNDDGDEDSEAAQLRQLWAANDPDSAEELERLEAAVEELGDVA